MNRIFIHGLNGSSQGVKATLLRGLFPDILTPDFRGPLNERMHALKAILAKRNDWVIVGSSLGGLMAAMFACEHPAQVKRLILLAPALVWPDFAARPPGPIDVPTVIYHGRRDEVVPLEPTRQIARRVFHNLDFRVVDDDHGLYQTVHEIAWEQLLI